MVMIAKPIYSYWQTKLFVIMLFINNDFDTEPN